VLDGSPGIEPLSISQISSEASIKVSAESINLGKTANTSVISNGGNIVMTASHGGIVLGSPASSNLIQANGGNLVLLASQNISGAASNQFIATSVGSATSSSGGGIELGAGTTISTLASAAAEKPGTVQGQFATYVVVNNPSSGSNSSGVVQANFSKGASGTNNINLSSSGTNAAVLNLNGGTIDLDASGSAYSVELNGASFTVAALKPISYTSSAAVTTDGDSSSAQGESVEAYNTIDIARILVSGGSKLLTLTSHGADINCIAGITLTSGELLISPIRKTTIHSEFGEIQLRKGALLSLNRDKSGLRAINCGATGDVVVRVCAREILLAAGEELVLSNYILSNNEANKADGIGRRRVQQFQLGSGVYGTLCDVSLISMLTNTQYMQALKHPSNSALKQMAFRLLKTASAIQTVSSQKGAYQAGSKELAKAI